MLKKVYPFIILGLIFLVPRFIIIHTYPPFNDESIHLAWGRLMISRPEARFISMDWAGRQPLRYWLFGIAEQLLPNHLFLAGRLVSLIFAFLGMVGVYMLTIGIAKTWDKSRAPMAAGLASLAYALCPFTVFIGSLALVEIMLMSACIWGFAALWQLAHKFSFKYALLAGFSFSIGYWFKSNMIIFMALEGLTLGWFILYSLVKKRYSRVRELLKTSIIIIVITLLVLYPLVTYPAFALTGQYDSAHAVSIGEILTFPLFTWFQAGLLMLAWYFWYIPITTLGIAFIPLFAHLTHRLRKAKSLRQQRYQESLYLLLFWFALASGVSAIAVRDPASRYFMPGIFPLFPLFGIGVVMIHNRLATKRIFMILGTHMVVILILLSITLSALLLAVNPALDIHLLKTLAPITNDEFHLVSGWPSGYGVPEAIAFLENESQQTPIVVLIDSESGNPEDAIITAFLNKPNIKVGQIPVGTTADTAPFLVNDLKIQNKPIFLVSRGKELKGLDNYVEEIKHFSKPFSKDYVGVYRLKEK